MLEQQRIQIRNGLEKMIKLENEREELRVRRQTETESSKISLVELENQHVAAIEKLKVSHKTVCSNQSAEIARLNKLVASSQGTRVDTQRETEARHIALAAQQRDIWETEKRDMIKDVEQLKEHISKLEKAVHERDEQLKKSAQDCDYHEE